VRQCFSELIDRNPNDAKPEWFAERAKALLYERSEQSAERAIEELEIKYPESSNTWNVAVEYHSTSPVRARPNRSLKGTALPQQYGPTP
jgi:hypothetical protein